MSDRNPDRDRDPQESARERQRERAEAAESAAADGEIGEMLSDHKFPATSEELAVDYGDEPVDMANETESMGSVLDRLEGERFDSAREVEEAISNELTGSEAGPEEYNDERDLTGLEEEVPESEERDQPQGPL
jgi:hypothetical protein